MIKVIVGVPARLNSSRLPKKILKDINGKPMLLRVLENCRKAKGIDYLISCTDTIEVVELIKKWGFNSILTGSSHTSGSERLNSIIDRLIPDKEDDKNTLVINVQSDLPYLDFKIIENMIELFRRYNNPPVLTPIYSLCKDEIFNPNVVKVVINNNDEALLFSRAAIPYLRDIPKEEWHEENNFWGHIGIYGFRGDILRKWKNYETSKLEKIEKLEQLRLIYSDVRIKCFKVLDPPLSVDTYDDLVVARSMPQTNKEL